jgi:hypothetical protein
MPNQNAGQPEQDNRVAKLVCYGRVFTAAMLLLAMLGFSYLSMAIFLVWMLWLLSNI